MLNELDGQRRYSSHGHTRGYRNSPTYVSWCMMKQRCSNPNYNRYNDYGGRGITFEPDWCEFETFLADMGERPEGTSLDRIDNNGNYTKDNCRWATPKQQVRNRRNSWRNKNA